MTTRPTPRADASDRLQTGISGLDAVLQGGIFRGGIYIIQGVPGSGKTILGNQMCFSQAAAGNYALYLTLLAETHARMMTHMRRLSFFNETAVPDRIAYLGAFRTLEEDGLKGLLDLIRREVRAHNAKLVVLDGLATVGESVSSNLELKKFVHELQTQAIFSDCTMLLLTSGSQQSLPFSPEYTMVDGLIELKTRMFGRRAIRELQVHKMRGSDSLGGEHAFRIGEDGISVFPRIEALPTASVEAGIVSGPRATSGIDVLDVLVGGGVGSNSATVALGPAGSGKTTLGLHFLSACKADEPGLLYSFHENPAALRAKAEMLGLAAAGHFDSGHVETIWEPHAEALLDEVCWRLLDNVRHRKVRRLVIDGVEGLQQLVPEKVRVEPVLTALCNELRSLGVTTMLTAETKLAGIAPGQTLAGLALTHLSSVAENIVVLRLAAVNSEIHRLIAVVKGRDSRIDPRMRRFEIGDAGLVIEPDYAFAEAILRELRQHEALPPRAMDPSLGGG